LHKCSDFAMHNDSSRSLRQAGSAAVSGEARRRLIAEGRDADVPLDGELRVELDQEPGRGRDSLSSRSPLAATVR
jgi:hypothetical protein